VSTPLARAGSQAQTSNLKLLKSDFIPLFDMIAKSGKLFTPSDTFVYQSGAYGLCQHRGSNDGISMRVQRETVFGNSAARLDSESDKDYVKRNCPSASQSESRPPISVRTRLSSDDLLAQRLFCPVSSSPNPSFFGRGVTLCLMDKGSVTDLHRVWPLNRTFVVVEGALVFICWQHRLSSQIWSSSTSRLDVFSDNIQSRSLATDVIKPYILRIGKGGCFIVRSGTFISIVATEQSGNAPIPC
jgi:hypothetical protein